MVQVQYTWLLLGAMAAFAIVGRVVCSLPPIRTGLWFGHDRYRLGHELLVGQVALLLYYYARSLAYPAFSRGITPIELWVIAGICLMICIVMHRHRFSGHYLRGAVRRYAGIYVLLPIAYMTCFCLTELPREVMLSSDPDDHAAWAHIIAQFGRIPGGDEPLGYPAGFAVLNALYMQLTTLDAPTIVSIQPLIQTLIALLVLAEMAMECLKISGRQKTRIAHPVTLAIVFGLFLIYFPYSFQSGRFYHEGMGRLSVIAFMALIFSFWFAVLLQRFRAGSAASFAVLLVVMRILILVLVSFNPSSPLISFVITEVLLLWCVPRGKMGKGLLIWAITLLVYAVVLADPYYHRLIANPAASADLPFEQQRQTLSCLHQLPNVVKDVFLSIAQWTWFRTDMFVSWGSQYFVMVCAVFLIALKRPRILAPIPVLMVVYLLANVMVSIFAATGTGQPAAILIKYTKDNGQQFFYLFLLLTVIATCFSLAAHRARVLLVIALAIAATPAYFDRNTTSPFHHHGRHRIGSTVGDPTPNDKAVIRKIKAWGESRPSDRASPAERILVMANYIVINDGNEYLFSFGGSRRLVYDTPLPLAFYYHLGPKAFARENYLPHVRDYLDLPWLVQQGVRYIYMPEGTNYHHIADPKLDGYPVRLMFKEGGCRFYEIDTAAVSSLSGASGDEAASRKPIQLTWEAVQHIEVERAAGGTLVRPTGRDPQMRAEIPSAGPETARTLYLSIESTKPMTLLWYYDMGAGYSDEASVYRRIDAGKTVLPINIPAGLRYLRLDPVCDMTILGAELVTSAKSGRPATAQAR